MPNRITILTSASRRAPPIPPLPIAHLPSAPLSTIHHLSTPTRPYTSVLAQPINHPPLKPTRPPTSIRPTQRTSSSFWPLAHPKSTQHHLIETCNRYSNLSDRDILLLFLGRQEESLKRQAKRVRNRIMSKLAVRVAWVGLGSYFYFYVLPQWAAAVEKNGKNSVQVWNVMLTNQRLMLKKLVEIEKRSEE